MNNLMEYKGYHAKIEYSSEDELLVGRVVGITDILAFHGWSLDELKAMFHNSIDNYLDMCREAGKQPDQEYLGTFSVTIPAELYRKAAIAAESKGISLDLFVEEILRSYLATV